MKSKVYYISMAIASVVFAIGGIGILLSNAVDGSLTWISIFWGGVGVSGLWSGIDHWKNFMEIAKDGMRNEEEG